MTQQLFLHPNQITQWRSQLLENAAGASSAPTVGLKAPHAEIGELVQESDILKGDH